LARTLLHHPSTVLLDEPTSALAPERARDVRELLLRLRGEQRAILLSTHNLDEVARVADRVAVLRRRLVAVATPAAPRAPFFVAVIVPAVTGERLADSSDFKVAVEMYRSEPGTRELDPEAAIQAWIFQQFLILLVLTPVAGSMSVAAYSVIGEKQARTLEP